MISLTKASVLYWTAPIFTAIFAKIHLKERITQFDWYAAILAFVGIFIMQNPFSASSNTQIDSFHETIGASLAISGAITLGMVSVMIKKMGKEVHYLMSPLSWAIANLVICPVFTGAQRIAMQPQTHSYSWYDVLTIVSMSLFQLVNLTFQTLAYQFEKAGRVAPILYS
jgi:drug/metabolite transporter (DMT)-like permease